jgi:hypothetical protein
VYTRRCAGCPHWIDHLDVALHSKDGGEAMT